MGRPTGRKYSATTALRLEPALRAKLERLAKAEERSVAAIIRLLLKEAISARDRQKKAGD